MVALPWRPLSAAFLLGGVGQHVPKEMTGLSVEQNAWRVVSIQDGEALFRQRIRQPDGTRTKKEAREKVSKLLGLFPGGGIGKLQRNKAALLIHDNYGLAILDHAPDEQESLVIIPFHNSPSASQACCEMGSRSQGMALEVSQHHEQTKADSGGSPT